MILLLLPLIAMAAPGARKVSITSDAPGNRIAVGEKFHITIKAENCTGDLSISEMPPGVKFLYKSTYSQQNVDLTRGINENSTSLILTLKAETPGDYKFGPVSVNGVKSNVLSYKVIPASASNQAPAGSSSSGGNSSATPKIPDYDPNQGPIFIGKGNEEMFLVASVNKTTAYEQEAIEYTVKLYSSYSTIKFIGAASAPKFESFVIEESKYVSNSLEFEQYRGKYYSSAIVARYIIFPQKAGRLKIEGNTYTVSTDRTEYYHDPYFQRMSVRQPIQLNITPNDIYIDVKSLPQPIPQNFIGGVGTFRLSTQTPTKQLLTNTPAAITYTIEGEGNVKYIKLPELKPYFPASFEIYTPEVTENVEVGRTNVSGSIKFDYSFMPRSTGSFDLSDIKFSYFDPQAGEYKTLVSKGMKLTVGEGASSGLSQKSMTYDYELMPTGELPSGIGRPYITSLLYWLWFVIPACIFVAALGVYRKYIRDHEDLTALRSKKANKMAMKRLAKAYQCFKNHQEEQFYDEMLKALWGYIGDKLKMPTSALNRSNVGEEFKTHGVKESTFMPIINLIDECEYAKYTPVARDANMRQLYADAIQSLAKVEDEYTEQQKGSATPDEETADNENEN